MLSRPLLAGLCAAVMSPGCAPAAPPAVVAEQASLAAAIASPKRTPANLERDAYRHPLETLTFFGVKPTDTLVEIFPGGGWYSEILAPYVLNGGGTYYAAAPDRGLNGFRKLAATDAALYGRARLAAFPVRTTEETGVPDGSADVVVTFRNVHNWLMDDVPYEELAFRQMFIMLKPGGVLGVEEHRLPESADSSRERSSGYLKVSTVRRLAEAAGFRFVAASEINANPKDSADWPDGVWTLPPAFTLKDKDREKYRAIGESDRMTLKFVKPR